ncbi:MAG: hypothetical protein ACYC6M_05770 [Terriglobales bacterium]
MEDQMKRQGGSGSRQRQLDFEEATAEITRRMEAAYDEIYSPDPVLGLAVFPFEREQRVLATLREYMTQFLRLALANPRLAGTTPERWARAQVRPMVARHEQMIQANPWLRDAAIAGDGGSETWLQTPEELRVGDVADATFCTRVEAEMAAALRDFQVDQASVAPRLLGRQKRREPSEHEKRLLAAIREQPRGPAYCKRADLDTQPPSGWPGNPKTYHEAYADKRTRPMIWKERYRVKKRWIE